MMDSKRVRQLLDVDQELGTPDLLRSHIQDEFWYLLDRRAMLIKMIERAASTESEEEPLLPLIDGF
jgi:hypothetical protein